jgi:hypothetical protein
VLSVQHQTIWYANGSTSYGREKPNKIVMVYLSIAEQVGRAHSPVAFVQKALAEQHGIPCKSDPNIAMETFLNA